MFHHGLKNLEKIENKKIDISIFFLFVYLTRQKIKLKTQIRYFSSLRFFYYSLLLKKKGQKWKF